MKGGQKGGQPGEKGGREQGKVPKKVEPKASNNDGAKARGKKEYNKGVQGVAKNGWGTVPGNNGETVLNRGTIRKKKGRGDRGKKNLGIKRKPIIRGVWWEAKSNEKKKTIKKKKRN